MELGLAQNEETGLMATDSKFRSYASSMDKALKAFEGTGEWADLINSLAKMQKVIMVAGAFCSGSFSSPDV